MVLEKHPFQTYGKGTDTFNVRLSKEEREKFEEWKYLIQQEKDSTAIKQLAEIGANVLQEKKTKAILDIILNNYRRNKRLGIVTFE